MAYHADLHQHRCAGQPLKPRILPYPDKPLDSPLQNNTRKDPSITSYTKTFGSTDWLVLIFPEETSSVNFVSVFLCLLSAHSQCWVLVKKNIVLHAYASVKLILAPTWIMTIRAWMANRSRLISCFPPAEYSFFTMIYRKPQNEASFLANIRSLMRGLRRMKSNRRDFCHLYGRLRYSNRMLNWRDVMAPRDPMLDWKMFKALVNRPPTTKCQCACFCPWMFLRLPRWK